MALIACFAGLSVALVVLEPLFGLVGLAGLLLVAGIRSRVWLVLTWFILSGLLLWSYGFNNIPIPLGPIKVPMVDVVLLYALVASFPVWKPVLDSRLGRQILGAAVILVLVAAGRLAIDLPRYGILAGRDALYVLQASGVFVGIAVGRSMSRRHIELLLSVAFGLAIVWGLLSPFRETFHAISPMVGVQRPERLFSWTGSAHLVVATLWFFSRGKRTGIPFTVAGLMALLFDQSRSSYILIPLGLLAVWAVDRLNFRSSGVETRLVRVGVAGIAAAAILALVSGLPGGRAEVGYDTLRDQVGTLLGQEGLRSGTIEHRRTEWANVVDAVRRDPFGPMIGIGYGPDLFGGHTGSSGTLTRLPHNDPLETWARTGLVGLAAWLGLLFLLIRGGLRGIRDHPWGGWVVGLHIGMLGVCLVQPLFSFAYGGMVYYILVGLTLGVHALWSPHELRASSNSEPNHHPLSRAVAAEA